MELTSGIGGIEENWRVEILRAKRWQLHESLLLRPVSTQFHENLKIKAKYNLIYLVDSFFYDLYSLSFAKFEMVVANEFLYVLPHNY